MFTRLPARRPRPGLAALPLLALLLSACQTYTQRSQSRDEALRSGDIATALTESDRALSRADPDDLVLLQLEHATLLRAAALANLPHDKSTPAPPAPAAPVAQTQTSAALLAASPADISPRIAWLTRSIAAFEEALRRIQAYDEAARVSLSSETTALFTNQAALPYRGRAYDRVMLHTYQALNYLQLADPAAARVELNRALQSQRDALAANARRIEETRALAERSRSGVARDPDGRSAPAYDTERALADPRTSAGLSTIEARLDAAILPYGDYVNPFTTFLDALVFTQLAGDSADLERGRKSWERVLTFAPDNPHVRADHLAADPTLAATAPPPPHGITYLIFETGSSPYRGQTRIDLPLLLFTDNISYVGMALPELNFVPGHIPALEAITSDGQRHRSSLLASMDSVIARDFRNEWPTILTKTILATATKATLDAVLQKQLEDQVGPTGALLARIATAVTQAALNIADTRSWRSLPKEFHYARLPTPPDHRLTLQGAGLARSVDLEPVAVQVVYVKSPSPFSPLLVTRFTLRR
jgi:hypothetical protein